MCICQSYLKKNKSGTFLVHRVDVSLISADIGSSVEDGVVATSLDDLQL